jgi:hypothetical protein
MNPHARRTQRFFAPERTLSDAPHGVVDHFPAAWGLCEEPKILVVLASTSHPLQPNACRGLVQPHGFAAVDQHPSSILGFPISGSVGRRSSQARRELKSISQIFRVATPNFQTIQLRETNTEHVPGIHPADAQELLDRGSKVVVLSRGMQSMLRTCPETLQLLKDKGVGVHVEETREAAEVYNKLAEREPVGGLFLCTW